MDLQAFDALDKLLHQAARTEDKAKRRELATMIWTGLVGEAPTFDPGLVERLKALNQQFSDEKNKAVADLAAMTARAKDAEARAARADEVIAQHKAFTKKRADILRGLAELIEARGDIEDAVRTISNALEGR